MKRMFEKSWGAELVEGGTRFRLWAPAQERPLLRSDGTDHPMEAVGDGWFEVTVEGLGAGASYAFALDNGQVVPDPASRAQAGDVHGPSRVIDPTAFDWSPWSGRDWEEAVILEVHIGTFTPQGTFRAAIEKLP
ncbi:MAG: malto-oligosyltrehalose trehalohydrolase, partial [Roseinatronobacter sp.]